MKTTRREFLSQTAGTAGALAVSRDILLEPAYIPSASQQAVPASDRIRFAIIGVGMQGSGLLTSAITLPGVECVAAADMLERVVQKLVSTHAISGSIADRNGNAGVATWTYTPTAAA